MTVVIPSDRDDFIRHVRPLLRMLVPEVRRWLDEQKALVDEPRYRDFVAVAERFDKLSKRVNWVAGCFARTHHWEPEPDVFEATLALAAIAVAAESAAPHALHDRPVPSEVIEAFLALWLADLPRHPDVTAPQVAAAHLSGGWSPIVARFEGGWEAARLFLEAMAYKSTRHGLHQLANWNEPLAVERRDEPSVFNRRVVEATHQAAFWLLVPGDRASDGPERLVGWDWEKLTLWEFLAGAILGPGRPGVRGDEARPQAGAIKKCLLGPWAQREIGIIVVTVEVYVCGRCPGFRREPSCENHPSAAMVATCRRHQFVIPRDRLPESRRHLGHVQTTRKICKYGPCVDTLIEMLGRDRVPGRRCEQQPIYRVDLDACPYCHSRGTAGQRPITVWTRFP